MRKASAFLTLILALLLFLPAITKADTGSPFDQEVSFGITQSQGNQNIPVFENTTSNRKTDLLSPNLLCSILDTTLQGKYSWYHIIYLNEQGEHQTGYVKESNFKQLTFSDYTQFLIDPEIQEQAEQLITLSQTSSLFQQAQASANSSAGARKQQYILNTNTKKFHYPSCKSVNQIKEKNKKPYTGNREEIIEMGYVPCKNCNP